MYVGTCVVVFTLHLVLSQNLCCVPPYPPGLELLGQNNLRHMLQILALYGSWGFELRSSYLQGRQFHHEDISPGIICYFWACFQVISVPFVELSIAYKWRHRSFSLKFSLISVQPIHWEYISTRRSFTLRQNPWMDFGCKDGFPSKTHKYMFICIHT